MSYGNQNKTNMTKLKKIGTGFKYFNKRNVMCIQLHLQPFLTSTLSKESFKRIYVVPQIKKCDSDYVVLAIKEQ